MRAVGFFCALLWICVPAFAELVPGHHLPTGSEQSVRERQVDFQRLAADLVVDMERQTIRGSVTVTFTPLRTGLETFFLDAADLDIESVENVSRDPARDLAFTALDRRLEIAMPAGTEPGDVVSIRIAYRASPTTGLYFFPANENRTAEAWNYGEGGRHYNWLPMYNDTNERFAVDFKVTVDEPYVVLGNGILREVKQSGGRSRTFHWQQDEPIANYLLALKIGEFVEVPLADAKVGGRDIPLSVWTHAGDEAAAAFSFSATPAMIEYFSELLAYEYAWPKYDQVTLRNFWGAMETSTMVGFTEGALHLPGGLRDNAPRLEEAYPSWATEDTIAHEVAHHWFGNLVTCRSLASLWLNESFATYLHTVWNGHAYGEDDLTYQRWRYLKRYLAYIADTGEVRPLEYFRYDTSDDMYVDEITYFKGALLLHFLRHVLGDQDFYRSLTHFLETYTFAEVDSADFQRSLETVTGRDLDWFFTDWVRGGGGYPALSVSWLWVPERSELDLTIEQVQAEQPFEGYFDLPVDVEIVTESGAQVHTVRLDERQLQVALPADSEPVSVVVDKGNWLVADIHQDQPVDAVIHQLLNGDLAIALRAAQQLARDYPRDLSAVAALADVLTDSEAHWGLRQEAALNLGTMAGDPAVRALIEALGDPNSRIRRAAAIGLGRSGGEASAETLVNAITNDPAEEVVGAASVALGKMNAPAAGPVLLEALERDSRYYDVIRYGALLGLTELEDPALAPVFERFTDAAFNHDVRAAAIRGWVGSAPRDKRLQKALRKLAGDPDYGIRQLALEKIGELHHADDLGFLDEYANTSVDPNLVQAARDAAAVIEAFTPG